MAGTSIDLGCVIGPQGEKGETGAAGPGVPAGGTAGQVLVKNGAEDYDAGWAEPKVGGVDVIWVNASQASSFGAQTISLDLSNYHTIMIVFMVSPGPKPTSFFNNIVNRNTNSGRTYRALHTRVDPSDSTPWTVHRYYSVDFDAGTIAFENGIQYAAGSSGSTWNTRAIPLCILGCKGAES